MVQLAEQMMRPKHVAERLGVSIPTVWRWVGIGALPRPVKLSSRASAWRVSVIEAFVTEREQAMAEPEQAIA